MKNGKVDSKYIDALKSSLKLLKLYIDFSLTLKKGLLNGRFNTFSNDIYFYNGIEVSFDLEFSLDLYKITLSIYSNHIPKIISFIEQWKRRILTTNVALQL